MAKSKNKRKAYAFENNNKRQKIRPETNRSRGGAHGPSDHKKSNLRHLQQSQHPPDVPFKALDDILLVGEGDFSFTHCISSRYAHQYTSLTATSLDPEQDVFAKYPQAIAYMKAIRRSNDPANDLSRREEDTFQGVSPNEEAKEDNTRVVEPQPRAVRVLHNIDATRLNTIRAVRSVRDGYDWIVFQFPHVGGKSTDVNRQVRSNQQLLVGFFEKARGMLRRRGRQGTPRFLEDLSEDREELVMGDHNDGHHVLPVRSSDDGQGGRVLVTLFEGEPYTLWNIRDLARHCGYVVERSWQFRWEAFPGYSHVRTLGNIRSHQAREDSKVQDDTRSKKAAWKGEDRQARTFCFYVKPDEEGERPSKKSAKRKTEASNGGSSDNSDSDI